MKIILYIFGLFAAIMLAPYRLLAQGGNQTKLPEFKKDAPYTPKFRDTFTLKMVENQPENTKNLSILLNPAYIDLYGLNVNMGYDAMIRYTSKNLVFWASYRGTYLETVYKNTIAEDNSLGGPASGTASLKNVEIGAEYNYISRKESNEEYISLGRHDGLSFSRRISADYLLNYGYRVGLQYFETYISGDQVPFSGYYINDPGKHIVNFGLGQVGTVMQENIINLGYSMTNTHSLVVGNPTLGVKNLHYRTYIYGDLMVAPSIVYSNVIMKNYSNISQLQYTDFNLNSATAKNRFGARIGYMYSDLSTAGLTFGFEGGVRPGATFVSGLYAMGKFGIAINAKI